MGEGRVGVKVSHSPSPSSSPLPSSREAGLRAGRRQGRGESLCSLGEIDYGMVEP